MLMKYEKMGDTFYCGNDKEYKLYTGVYVWMCDQNKEEWVYRVRKNCISNKWNTDAWYV